MKLRTIPNVPIVATGTYKLASGETTFSKDDLASAVLAANDPTVRAPRIKIGHTDERFDGEPAMGSVRNMRLDRDGNVIVGDLVDVPEWLAAKMQSAYPGRSVEGGFGYTAPSGHDYNFVISNLALLGETWPGVTSMEDLREVMERNGEIAPVAASDGEPFEFSEKDGVKGKVSRAVIAAIGDTPALDAEDEREVKALMAEGKSRAEAVKIVEESSDEANENRAAARKRTTAALDVGAIPRRFAADLRSGKLTGFGPGAWARSVEAEDDGSLALVIDEQDKLVRLPFTVADKDVNYGEPVPVAASNGSLTGEFKGPRVLASWPSSKPLEAKTMQIGNVEVDQAVVAKSLGLADDADEAAIVEKLKNGEVAASTPPPKSSEAKLPDGIVAIDAEKLAELESKANAGAEVAASAKQSHRDDTIKGAVKGGRIAASQISRFTTLWDTDPAGTEKLLTASPEDGGLAPVIPVEARERGVAGDPDSEVVLASVPRLLPELNDNTEVAA